MVRYKFKDYVKITHRVVCVISEQPFKKKFSNDGTPAEDLRVT